MTEREEDAVRSLAAKGDKLSMAEVFFCSDMLDKYPDRYREIYREVRDLQRHEHG